MHDAKVTSPKLQLLATTSFTSMTNEKEVVARKSNGSEESTTGWTQTAGLLFSHLILLSLSLLLAETLFCD
jgi:hypothetical protein